MVNVAENNVLVLQYVNNYNGKYLTLHFPTMTLFSSKHSRCSIFYYYLLKLIFAIHNKTLLKDQGLISQLNTHD